MRDVNRLQRAIIVLVLYTRQLLEAIQDYASTVRENQRGLMRGAADPDWQHTLSVLAAPVREERRRRETGEQQRIPSAAQVGFDEYAARHLEEETIVLYEGELDALIATPALAAVPVVTETGTVVDTIPTPPEHIRRHRTFDVHPVEVRRPRKVAAEAKRRLLATGAPEVLEVERKLRHQLDTVVLEAMRALGLDAEEAKAILGLHTFERNLGRALAAVA